MSNTVSSSYCMKLGFISAAALLVLMLFFWAGNSIRQFDENNFLIINNRQYSSGNGPEIHLDMLQFSNETDNFRESLKAKYGDVRISGTQTIGTKLNVDEEEQFRLCVLNGVRDRNINGSKFWAVQQIRRTHHKYLAREDAVLMEVGGNKGNDASVFARLYNPRYIILEPLEEYANILKEKFKDNPRVTVINLGLGEKNEVVMVKIQGSNACATSKFSGAGGKTPLYITNATEFLLKIGLGLFDIDLLTMNCEGCEFEALETILSTNLVKHLRNIQFATHSTIKGLKEPIQRYCKIQQLLWRTHRPTYQFKFIWESWRRREKTQIDMVRYLYYNGRAMRKPT